MPDADTEAEAPAAQRDAMAMEGVGPGRRRRERHRHPKSHYWGPFSILYRPSKATKSGKETSAAWEATCWAAAHTLKQSCKKTMSTDTANDDAETITL